MKILIICFLLSTLSLTFAVPAFDFLQSSSSKEQNKDEISALLQVLASSEDDQDTDDGTVANLQGMFNMMAQVEAEKARQQHDKNVAMVQFWGRLGRGLWNVGKGLLKKKYCTQQGAQDGENTENGDGTVRAELQTLFNALTKVEAKVMQDDTSDDNAKAEGWFNKLKHWVGKKAKGLTKKHLC